MAIKKGMMKKAMDNLSLFILSLILIGGILVLIDNNVTASDHECGNNICDFPDEDSNSCPEDCYAFCGDDICDDPDEDSSSCSEDCYCGDDICDNNETIASCIIDCCDPEVPPSEPNSCDPY